ncbi:hypothetical protein SELMODRAFT_444401 [Selaginella moellendorffii]|uniref:Uncharacterized protein n=1 Tax=Selaginella moellendorffii TaxID=88036 RepID=D8S9M2_SELML|nr:hypothetical protein SELMODRAFT_444401 [Selaginella moellendorffii]
MMLSTEWGQVLAKSCSFHRMPLNGKRKKGEAKTQSCLERRGARTFKRFGQWHRVVVELLENAVINVFLLSSHCLWLLGLGQTARTRKWAVPTPYFIIARQESIVYSFPFRLIFLHIWLQEKFVPSTFFPRLGFQVLSSGTQDTLGPPPTRLCPRAFAFKASRENKQELDSTGRSAEFGSGLAVAAGTIGHSWESSSSSPGEERRIASERRSLQSQGGYCSRFYPGSPSQDICDWCSQDPNPSTGSSSAGTSSTKLRGVLKLGGSSVIGGGGGASKRKVAGQLIGESLSPVTGATNWPRKDESDRDTRTKLQGSNDTGKKRDENAMIRNSTGAGSPRSSIKHGHKDALELLLEVAQTVAADNGAMDQTIMGGDAIKNPLARQCSIDRPSSSGRLQVAVTTSSSSPSPKRQKIATTTPVQAGIRGDHHHPHHYHDNDHHHQQQKQQQQQQHHHGFKNLIKGHHGGLRKDKLQHLSSNRSIGRRYKLLSDVMC